MRSDKLQCNAQEIAAIAKLKAMGMAENMTEAEAWAYYAKAVDRLYREYQRMRRC